MFDKLKEKAKEDPLFVHKTCVVIGTVSAFLLGLVISDRAEKYEFSVLEELDATETD